jgi:hypothetical protein
MRSVFKIHLYSKECHFVVSMSTSKSRGVPSDEGFLRDKSINFLISYDDNPDT